MTAKHVVTFYSIEKIEDYLKVGRSVERFCTKRNIVGTFFSTSQGINTTLSGRKIDLEELISMLDTKFNFKLQDLTWSITKAEPFKRLKIKCREKLLPLDGNFDPTETSGKHLNYSEWNSIISDPDTCLLYTSPSPRDGLLSRMPSSA